MAFPPTKGTHRWVTERVQRPAPQRAIHPSAWKGYSANYFALTGYLEVALLGSYPAAERGGPFGKGILHSREKSDLRRNYDG